MYAKNMRLVGGVTVKKGRVEILHNGIYGTVCDDYWDDDDAKVVCRQLGFKSGKARAEAYFGQGTGKIWLDDVKCTGNEDDLTRCPSNTIGTHDCTHIEDAGVECEFL